MTPAVAAELQQAQSLRLAGRGPEAAGRLARLVDRAPDAAEAWAAFADCLLSIDQPNDAAKVCELALSRLGDQAPVLLLQVRALAVMGRRAPQLAALRRAVALAGGDEELAFALALQAVEAGEWGLAEQAVGPWPAAAASARRVWLAARVALGRGDLEAARTQAERAAAGLPRLDQQAEAALLLGEALDGLGRHREAFAAFTRGKAGLRRVNAERAGSREAEVEKLRRLAAWFDTADPAHWRAAPGASGDPGVRGHAFLLGFPRSGTTLLEQALASHPDLVALEEAPTLADAYAAFLAGPAGLERLARLTAEEAEHWRGVYWRAVAAHGVDAKDRVFLDKAPAGTLYLPLIAKLFPSARLLFAVRDPRDVVLSCFRSAFQMNAMTYAFTDLAESARCYVACMDLADVYRRVLPIVLHEVRYERLVGDFEGELARVAARLGLALSPGMTDLEAAGRRRTVRTPSAPQLRAGLNRQGVGRWRGYADELAPVLPILQPWIDRYGYPSLPVGEGGREADG